MSLQNNVIGTNQGETLTAGRGDGANTKYDAKGGNDIVIGSTGDDLIIGGAGSDVLFGGAGADTFVFDKFASRGDTDFIRDFHLELGDKLFIGAGTTIVGANAFHSPLTEFNGSTLGNDSRLFDLELTLRVVDGAKDFTYTVTLMDVLKNATWSAATFDSYLQTLGYDGGITFA